MGDSAYSLSQRPSSGDTSDECIGQGPEDTTQSGDRHVALRRTRA